MELTKPHSTPTPFIWRRVHSLMGFWLIIYLIEHLIVNSQAALWIGDDGSGFVRLVNSLESLPYLQVIETVFIAIPFGVHMVWGIKRAYLAKTNSHKTDQSKPELGYGRNRAYTWQRITSWILIVGVLAHVVQMRFVEMPRKVYYAGQERSVVKISFDEGLYTLAARLGVILKGPSQASQVAQFDMQKMEQLDEQQDQTREKEGSEQLSRFRLKSNQVLAISPNPGTAMLLMVRDTFKNPVLAVLYTLFVLAATFHAFNGLWTFLITWGVLLSYRSQKTMVNVCLLGMAVLAFLGLAAIWGSYWINLRS